jgi:hypothetical protein
MKNKLIVKPIRNARTAAGGALGVFFTAVAVLGGTLGVFFAAAVLGGALGVFFAAIAVLGGSLAPKTPVETMKPSVVAAEVGTDAKPSSTAERLYGTWIAKDVDTKLGEVKIRLTFLRRKKAALMAWSDIPFVGQVRDLKGAFSVVGDTISSEAIRDGKKADFSFENDQLVLRFKSGRVVRFDRE